ncbi:MAG: sterol desaturase family protein [Planctomycetes bacterium]|nr:sterol desaturase family protein [Planctomycetota bacterium]
MTSTATRPATRPDPNAALATKPEPNASPTAPNTLGGLVHTMLTRGSPRILLALVLAFGAFRVYLGGWSWVDLVVPVVILVWWPFQEWLIHSYLLHFKPRKLGPFTIDSMQAAKHRRHHLHPWDFEEISIPLHTYVYAVPILCALGYVFRDVPAVFTGLTVFLGFGVHYEWCHFMAHSNYVPKSKLYKAVWRNHRLHHFKNENLWMGVSSRVGDLALGTCPDQKTVERSPTCRTLGVAPPA